MAYRISDNRLKILVLGYIVRGPIAGMTWHHIQYVLGLSALGHDVSYYEDSGDSPYCCYNPITDVNDSSPDYGLTYLKNLFIRLNLNITWAYFDFHSKKLYRNNKSEDFNKNNKYDLLINLSLSNPLRNWMLKIPVRVLIDTDPVFTQIRNIQDPKRNKLTSQHNVFLTFGENIDSTQCQIPADGFNWQTTRQPIVLDLWLNQKSRNNDKFTNIMQWNSYQSLTYNGISYGLKSESFGPFFDLPNKTDQKLEIALGSSDAPRQELRNNKWLLINPLEISKDPWKYRKYIQESKAEFSIAKEAYVKSYSGWFSERSAAYLSSGKPVLAHETGFSEWVETGNGLLSFKSPDEALMGIDEINGNYDKHCEKAKDVATEYFNATSVLNSLVEYSMNTIE